jgi:hypothetical protein
MSLPAREQRALDAIEHALAASEPRMKAMFAMFAKLTRGEAPISPENLSHRYLTRWRPGTLYVLIPALAVMALIAALVVGFASSGVFTGCTAGAAAGASRSAVSCVAKTP